MTLTKSSRYFPVASEYSLAILWLVTNMNKTKSKKVDKEISRMSVSMRAGSAGEKKTALMNKHPSARS